MILHFVQKFGIFCFVILTVTCNVNKGKSVSQGSVMKDTLIINGCREKINVNAGSLVEIRLEAVQGTGFQWLLKEPSPLVSQINPEVLEFTAPETQEETPGQAGFQILRFKAIEKGKGEILLEYKRTFEAQVDKSCRMTIVIE